MLISVIFCSGFVLFLYQKLAVMCCDVFTVYCQIFFSVWLWPILYCCVVLTQMTVSPLREHFSRYLQPADQWCPLVQGLEMLRRIVPVPSSSKNQSATSNLFGKMLAMMESAVFCHHRKNGRSAMVILSIKPMPRSTQPSTLQGIVKWVWAFRLSVTLLAYASCAWSICQQRFIITESLKADTRQSSSSISHCHQ